MEKQQDLCYRLQGESHERSVLRCSPGVNKSQRSLEESSSVKATLYLEDS